MSLPFSRSLRSLHTDSYLVSRIGLILALIAISALLFWFFFGEVSLFETSSNLEINAENNLLAQFEPETAARLLPGSDGRLQFASPDGEQVTTVPVYVFRIDRESGLVELIIGNTGTTALPIPGKVEGTVRIETARITPVEVVVRSGLGGSQPTSPASESNNP